MRVTIHQPDFIPWIGFFHKWKNSDLLILYDDAQFIKGGWQNRDKIKAHDKEQWITVPVITKGKLGQLIKDVDINCKVDWKRNHLNTFKTYYGKTSGFNKVYPAIELIYNKNYKYLIDLNVDMLKMAAKFLNISVPFVFSS